MRVSLLVLALAASCLAGAQALVADNFDSDSLGNINGVGGWTSSSEDFNVVPGGGTRPAAFSGNQMLAVNATDVTCINYIAPAWNSRTAGNDLLVAEIELYVRADDQTGRSVNFAISGNTGNLLADIGYTTSGNQFFGDSTKSGFISGPSGTTGVWHQLQIMLDFDTQTSNLFVDGSALGTVSFDSSEQINSVALIAASGTGTTEAYYDSLSAQAVPEPEPVAVLSIGLLPIAIRRLRKGK